MAVFYSMKVRALGNTPAPGPYVNLMNTPKFLLLTLSLSVSLAQGREVFFHGFESYPAGSNISGQSIGSTTWTAAGVLTGDLAVVSSAASSEGGNSLLVSDNGANRPRASVDLIAGSFITSAMPVGSVSFAVREDAADSGAGDGFNVTFNNLSVSRAPTGTSLYFSVTGGGAKVVNFSGAGYVYTPTAWNVIRVDFNDVSKSASIYVNGGFAGTITGSTASFAVSNLLVGNYSSTTTGDLVYFDALQVVQTSYFYNDGFETSTVGNIAGQPVGSSTWTAAGVLTGDQAVVSTAYARSGTKSLMFADNGGNRPRATVNLVNSGFIPAPAAGGEISFSVLEDPTDGGAGDSFLVNLSNLSVMRDATGTQIGFSVVNHPYPRYVPLSTENYVYTPGQWNTFTVAFNETGRCATLYINGGYAATLTSLTDPAIDYKVSALTFGNYASTPTGDKVYFDDISADLNGAPGVFDWRSTLYPANWTPGYQDADGHYLHDFSYAGYRGGAQPIPNVSGPIYNVVTGYGADPSGAADSTAAIQNAINAAQSAGQGVVYLPAGIYKVSPVGANYYSLKISGSNLVLRGAGASQTFILNSNPDMRLKSVIMVGTSSASTDLAASAEWYTGNTAVNLTGDLLLPTTQIPVTSTTGYQVGNFISIRNDLTQGLIDELGMTGVSGWTTPGSTNLGKMSAFVRRVVAVSPTSLTVDVPTRFPLKTRDNARVIKVTAQPLTGIGLESFSIGMVETTGTLGENEYNTSGTGAYKAHGAHAILVRSVENGWIRNVNTYKPAANASFHLVSNGIRLITSRFFTVESCDFRAAQYKGGGGNGYHYNLNSQEVLIKDCRAETGRHNFSFAYMYSCGNVFLNFYDKQSQNDSDFHGFLSMSNLIDSTTCDGEMLESRYRSEVTNPVPGWTSAHSVFWNTKGLAWGNVTNGTGRESIINSYQWANSGYLIGTQGPAFAVSTTDFAEGIGESAKLVPQSLYLNQRLKRLGF